MIIRENDMTMKCNPTIITIIRKKTDPPFENLWVLISNSMTWGENSRSELWLVKNVPELLSHIFAFQYFHKNRETLMSDSIAGVVIFPSFCALRCGKKGNFHVHYSTLHKLDRGCLWPYISILYYPNIWSYIV